MPSKHEPPTELEEIIRLVNSVPVTLELPSAMDMQNILELFRSSDFNRYRMLQRRMPKPPRKISIAQMAGFGRAYRELSASRELLRALAQSRSGDPFEFEQRLYRAVAQVPLSFVRPRVEDGYLRFSFGEMLRAFEGVEVQRVRQCPICAKIYWARRSDTPACPDHTGTVRTRRWRSIPEETRLLYERVRAQKEFEAKMCSKRMHAA